MKIFIAIIQNTQKKPIQHFLQLKKFKSFESLDKLPIALGQVLVSESWFLSPSVSPLSWGEDGVGVAVSLPLLLPLLLAVWREGLLQLLLALEEVSAGTQDLLLDFSVALHV